MHSSAPNFRRLYLSCINADPLRNEAFRSLDFFEIYQDTICRLLHRIIMNIFQHFASFLKYFYRIFSKSKKEKEKNNLLKLLKC